MVNRWENHPHPSMTTLQPDLFGEVEAREVAGAAADRQRFHDALTCMIDSCPLYAYRILIINRHPDGTGQGSAVQAGLTRPWAYSIRKAGFYFEWAGTDDQPGTWNGWDQRPAHLLTWDEFDALTAPDPRIALVRAMDRFRGHEALQTALQVLRDARDQLGV